MTIGSGPKVFSSGFNLKFWAESKSNTVLSVYLYHSLLARILTINIPSLCIFNGHAIAGGLMMGLAHDKIIMNGNE